MRKDALIRIAKMVGMWIPAILLMLIFARQGWSTTPVAGHGHFVIGAIPIGSG
jgi:hypothetical protein